METLEKTLGKSSISGYVKESIDSFKNRIKRIKKGEILPPTEVEIQPSSRCNSGCLHCWAGSREKLSERLNSKESFFKVIDELLNYLERDGKIKFVGSTGEPFMNKHTVGAIRRIGNQLHTSAFSNGILIGLNKENDEYLEGISNLNRLNLSLDAATTKTLYKIKPGAARSEIRLEDIFESAERIKDYGKENISIQASFVITPHNYHEIVLFARKLKRLGAVDYIRFREDITNIDSLSNYREEVVELLKQAQSEVGDMVLPQHSFQEILSGNYKVLSSRQEGHSCIMSNFWTCIAPNGNLYACGHIVDKNSPNYGNVLDNPLGFRGVWKSKERKELSKKFPQETCGPCPPFCHLINKHFSENGE